MLQTRKNTIRSFAKKAKEVSGLKIEKREVRVWCIIIFVLTKFIQIGKNRGLGI